MKNRLDHYIQWVPNCNVAGIDHLDRTLRWLWLIAKCSYILFAMTVVVPI